MKTLVGGVFIDKKVLKSEGINHPIKLEYYKRINEEQKAIKNKAKYGISIVKKEFQKGKTSVEEREIKYLTNDEASADYVLNVFKNNCVTPVELDDVICDFTEQILKKCLQNN